MLFFVLILSLVIINDVRGLDNMLMTTDDLENLISPEDLKEFYKFSADNDLGNKFGEGSTEGTSIGPPVPNAVDCFGLDSMPLPWMFNMQPDTSDRINVQYYFISRKQRARVQVLPGDQFGLEWVDFDPKKKTVVIIHGFMSHSNASWVNEMMNAFLKWEDMNVIAVDWSRGGNTWKYWRAVANSRRVGSDVTGFFQQLIENTGANVKDFHLVGHSLGAHICSYVSHHLGGVSRITGLDPAQPCFRTTDNSEKLDESDADFVDIIHTNGRLLHKIGFGLPDLTGHADFYPNGGMKQPGCINTSNFLSSLIPSPVIRLQQAICSHGRSYLLFTESLLQRNCSFRAHRWNLTYEGVNASLVAACDRRASCSEMGINSVGGQGSPRAKGAYFVLTTEKDPYCPTEYERRHPRADLLKDLLNGFRLNTLEKMTSFKTNQVYADPMARENSVEITTTTEKSGWKFWKWIG